MTDTVKIDFTDGDKMDGDVISICTICGRKGVRVPSMSSDTTEFEHILVYDPEKSRDRWFIRDGCFRQKRRFGELSY